MERTGHCQFPGRIAVEGQCPHQREGFQTMVIFDSIRVHQPLQISDETTYSGKLAALQTIILYPSADSILSISTPVTIHFISSKQAKIIGKDTLMVWEVGLGDMDF